MVKVDVHAEPQLVPELLLHVSVKELHNNLVSATIDGVLKEAIDEDDNICWKAQILLRLI